MLGHGTLNTADEEILNLRVTKSSGCLEGDLAPHVVAAGVLDRVVDTALGHLAEGLLEVLKLGALGVRHEDEVLAVHGVRDVNVGLCVLPLTVDQVLELDRVLAADSVRVERGPGRLARHGTEAEALDLLPGACAQLSLGGGEERHGGLWGGLLACFERRSLQSFTQLRQFFSVCTEAKRKINCRSSERTGLV